MAKRLKATLTDPSGKRVDQRETPDVQFGGDRLPAADIYHLVLADGRQIHLVRSLLSKDTQELYINWRSNETSTAEKIRRRLIKQAHTSQEFDQAFQSMKKATPGDAAELFVLRVYSEQKDVVEEIGPFVIEPGKPWKLSLSVGSKKNAAAVGISATGVCVSSAAFAPAGLDLNKILSDLVAVEIAPALSPQELAIINNDDSDAFRRLLLHLDCQGIAPSALRFAGYLPGFYRGKNFGLSSALGLANAVNCLRELVAFECERGRLCADDGAEQIGILNGKPVKMPPSTLWGFGFATWPKSLLPEVIEIFRPVFRLAFEQGTAEKVRHSLTRLGSIDEPFGPISELVREALASAEGEAIFDTVGAGTASKPESL